MKMSSKSDCTKILALGRQFAIGTLYNYIDDAIVPHIRLWDPDDMSRMTVVKSKTKKMAKVHLTTDEFGEEEDIIDDEKYKPWLLDFGMDDHSAMSFTAGLVRPCLGGAWQYATKRTDGMLENAGDIAIHCLSISKKVSVDPTGQLEIICRSERLNQSQATHVVVAVTYGMEAFCIFSGKNIGNKEMLDYARLFASGLVNESEHLELDDDEKPIPLDLHCILYSDLNLKSELSWTSLPFSEQFQSCRKVMDHQPTKAVPLEVWLYPLHKLISTVPKIFKTDFSRDLVIRCQVIKNWMKVIRSQTDMLSVQLEEKWVLPTIRQRINKFDGLLTKFSMALQKALHDWTISARQGAGLTENKMAEMVKFIGNNSPFTANELRRWIYHQRQQIKALELLVQLPGVCLLTETVKLEKEIRNGGEGCFAVVLHLPSLSEQSDNLVREMNRFVDLFSTSHSSSWTQWTREVYDKMGYNPVNRRRILTASNKFSEWAMDQNCEAINHKYIIFYDERNHGNGQICTKLYDCGSEVLCPINYKIPEAPGELKVVKNRLGVIKLSWTAQETVELSGFLLQYKSGDRWSSIHHPKKTITIDYLQSDESYVFRVAAVTLGGRSLFSPVSEEVTVNPVCPAPDGVQIRSMTDNSVTIAWAQQLEDIEEEIQVIDLNDDDSDYENQLIVINSYIVECWADGNQDSAFIQRSTTNKSITLEPLSPNSVYCVQIRAVCIDPSGSNFYSPATPIFKIRTLRQSERAAVIVRHVSQKCSSSSSSKIDTYKLPLRNQKRGNQIPGVGHYVFGELSYFALAGKRRQRTILMLGATGSGKSTLINAMINYILGVEWQDDFRFKLIDEPTDKSQAHSQTDLVTTYNLYEMKGSRLNYSLTVVDTPGFGDTRGLEKDKEIMEQIRDYFKSRHGIQQLEAVCFVVQSSLPRLTATQQHIFDSILSIFGQDIKDNIRLMVTFADNALPPVLEAVKQAGIPSPLDPATGLPLHHKFNNSIFFTSNKKDGRTNEFNQTYFDMAVEGFDRFFDDLSRMESKSLTLTREVLEERKRLEALVEGLQMRTEIKLTRVDELEQIKKKLSENRDQMESNNNFEFEVEFLVPKSTDISGTGQFTTNCQKCKLSCHFPCRQSSDENKHLCSVMDTSGYCTICKCSWKKHFNQKFRYEMVKEKVMRSSDAIRKQYLEAVDETVTNEELLQRIQKEIDQSEKQLVDLMQATYPCIRRLDEIALRPHPFSTPDYIDLMITAEKQEHRNGYQQRITTLQKLRQMAEITAKLVVDQRISRRMSMQPKAERKSSSSKRHSTSTLLKEFFDFPFLK